MSDDPTPITPEIVTEEEEENENENKFTKVNGQNYTLDINSGTIEMKDNKVIVLVD